MYTTTRSLNFRLTRRYKSKERLEWESEFDGIAKFKEWILNFGNNDNSIATEEELDNILSEVKKKLEPLRKKHGITT